MTDWNAIATQTTGTAIAAGRPGPATLLDLAIVHVAIHDAVQAFEKRFEPYHVKISGASGSPIAAIATAAHDVLLNLFPAQAASLNTQYADYLASQGLSSNDPGVVVGQQAAAGILALRANDGRFPSNPHLSREAPTPACGDPNPILPPWATADPRSRVDPVAGHRHPVYPEEPVSVPGRPAKQAVEQAVR